MKYNININQYAAVNNFEDNLDLTDMAIFDFCQGFINSNNKNIKRFTINEKIFTWINYEMIIKQMPLLKMKTKDPIYRRLLKLTKFGLLEKHIMNNNLPVFRLTEKSDTLLFKTEGGPVKKPKGVGVKTEGGSVKKPNNNINNDNNINNNNILNNKQFMNFFSYGIDEDKEIILNIKTDEETSMKTLTKNILESKHATKGTLYILTMYMRYRKEALGEYGYAVKEEKKLEYLGMFYDLCQKYSYRVILLAVRSLTIKDEFKKYKGFSSISLYDMVEKAQVKVNSMIGMINPKIWDPKTGKFILLNTGEDTYDYKTRIGNSPGKFIGDK